MSDTKACPYCAETIKAAAIKCRYCQSDLVEPPAPVEPPEAAPVAAAPETPAPVAEGEPRDAEPVAAKAEIATPDEPRDADHNRVSTALVVGLSILVLLLAAGVGYLAWDLDAMNDDARARVTGRDAAAAHVQEILSYDHKTFDEAAAEAERLMTDGFRKEYGETVALVEEDALERESVVTAEVVAASVVSADVDRVEALLFVNQTTEAKDLDEPRVDLNRVVVTLVPGPDEDQWLVDGLDAL